SLDCASCHGDGVYAGRDAACFACHREDYAGTTDPSHIASNFPMDCTQCHSTTSFSGATFAHTSFPLTGGHTGLDCASCHDGGVYTGLPSDCVSCHRPDYDATLDPNHAASGFNTNCTDCHGTTTWIGARFEHTSFPLTGAHGGLDCTACHGDAVYAGRDATCFACHQADYAATTSPNHSAAGFPTDCSQCHGTTSFLGATFAHTTFPLTGGHTGLDCVSCHGNGVYNGLTNDCVFCHQNDYDATTNPRHGTAGFGTDCASCHDTTSWNGATFDHDANFFPIYSSTHRGKWNDCSDCHANPSNYSAFSCFNCHAHDRTRMDSKHGGVSGYRYDSFACYDCHPTGND
ncbi:MAG: cytochrome c3 family protein, partial [Synechococcaceae cyanobacterium]|nr:cytochrome c3 family protein [Synechococcaceae cyanobacterium]